MIKTSEIIWHDMQHQKLFQIIDEIKTLGINGGNFNSSQPKRIKTPLIKCVKTIPNRISETMFT